MYSHQEVVKSSNLQAAAVDHILSTTLQPSKRFQLPKEKFSDKVCFKSIICLTFYVEELQLICLFSSQPLGSKPG